VLLYGGVNPLKNGRYCKFSRQKSSFLLEVLITPLPRLPMPYDTMRKMLISHKYRRHYTGDETSYRPLKLHANEN
jgi:hypothetical protein